MSGPGQYTPDPTEGIIDPNDLPKPKIKERSCVRKKCRCPLCGRLCTRHAFCNRRLHDLGDLSSSRPIEIILHYSKHYCCECKKHFTIDTSHIAPPKSAYTNAVIDLAIRLIVEDGLPYREASWHLWRDHRVYVPFGTIKDWIGAAGKKTYSQIETDVYLDGALENFSGYIAVDEVYDGPFCILFIVDNRQYKRLMFRVLDKSPTSADISALFRAFHKILATRELKLYGITTDGSQLYTEPVQTVFPGVRHQICEFHVKKEINKAVLKAVAQVRRELKQTKTKRSKRGRPTTKEEKAIIRKNERIDAKITDLFDNRFLFVQKDLTASEWKTFRKITRGFPELRKLREMVDLVYGLYDRRCKRSTALIKLQKLRERLKRFDGLSDVLKKLESPTVDRSLVFLDDKKLPSTSNAVERGNRRFRKMQKTVYRVRTIDRIRERIALDMVRDSRLPSRRQTMRSLQIERMTRIHQLC